MFTHYQILSVDARPLYGARRLAELPAVHFYPGGKSGNLPFAPQPRLAVRFGAPIIIATHESRRCMLNPAIAYSIGRRAPHGRDR